MGHITGGGHSEGTAWCLAGQVARTHKFECHHHTHTHSTFTITNTITTFTTPPPQPPPPLSSPPPSTPHTTDTDHPPLVREQRSTVTSSPQGLSTCHALARLHLHLPYTSHLAALLPDEWNGVELPPGPQPEVKTRSPLVFPLHPYPLALCSQILPFPHWSEAGPLFRLHPPHYPLNTLIIPLLIRAAQQIGGCIRGRQCAGAYGIISY